MKALACDQVDAELLFVCAGIPGDLAARAARTAANAAYLTGRTGLAVAGAISDTMVILADPRSADCYLALLDALCIETAHQHRTEAHQ